MSDFVERRYKALNQLNSEDVKKYLLSDGYFMEKDFFPGIILPKNLEKITLQPLDWSKPQEIPRTHPITIIGQKPNKGMREYSLMHPFVYIHLVNEMTEKKFWEVIKNRLTAETNVKVYSTPLFGAKSGEEELGAWTYFSTIDPSAHLLTHDVEASVDIQNFYSSIYTHSIPWILLGKEQAKDHRNDYSLTANRLDKLMQNAHDGQTNGVLTGNEISDTIAELLLKDVDEKLSPFLHKSDSMAFRYKDDYRFLCKDYQEARALIEQLSNILNTDYNLVLNSSKTEVKHVGLTSEDLSKRHLSHIISSDFNKPPKDEVSGRELYDYLSRSVEAHTYADGKHYIDNILKYLVKTIRENNTKLTNIGLWGEPIIFLIARAIDSGVSVDTYGFGIIDAVIHSLVDESCHSAGEIVDRLVEHYQKSPSILVKLWIYTIVLSNFPEKAKAFLAKENSAIFKMARDTSASNARYFESRDPIGAKDKKELDKFELIKREGLKEIEESKATIISTMGEEDFDEWIFSYYDF